MRVWLILSLPILGGLGCAGCATEPEPPPSDGPKRDQVRLFGVKMHRFERDKLRYRAKIERLGLDRDKGSATGEQVSVRSDGARIDAPRARTDLKTKRTSFEGGVRVVDQLGRVMKTEVLHHDGVKDYVESEGAVTVEGENFSAEGSKLKGHIGAGQAGQLQVEGPIRAIFSPDKP